MMPARQKIPLRTLTEDEKASLEAIARSPSNTADRVARAKILLAVAAGVSFIDAARLAGRRSGDAVAHLVVRFNEEGLQALDRGHGGGSQSEYGRKERERIIQEARRAPTTEQDGTTTWSLTTLQKALRKAPDGLPKVSTWTISKALHEAGVSLRENSTQRKSVRRGVRV